MKKLIWSGICSLALAQMLYAVDAKFWWQLDKANIPPPGRPTMGNTLDIWEDSTLNITTLGSPLIGYQWYFGSVELNHNLTINVNVSAADMAEEARTKIYYLNDKGRIKTFAGNGKLDILLYSNNPQRSAAVRSLFRLQAGTLIFNSNSSLQAQDTTKVHSIFRVEGSATFETQGDFIVDLSQAQGTFHPEENQANGTRKAIFDTAGTVNLNPDGKTDVITQLTGDVVNFGGRTSFKLYNADSFFKGNFDLFKTGNNEILLNNGASADFTLRFRHTSNFQLSLNNDSIAKLRTIFYIDNGANLNISVDHSSLYADFDYIDPNNNGMVFTSQGNIDLKNQATWYMSKTSDIVSLKIDNDEALITRDNLLALTNLTAVDMRFDSKGERIRNEVAITQDTQRRLGLGSLQGSNGVFRMTGVFNREGWQTISDEATGEFQQTIATDIITTNQAFNTHYVQLFWSAANFDKSLLNTDLTDKNIIVVKQNSLNTQSDFVGKETPIGLYNYITNLKRVFVAPTGAEGDTGGWNWIVSNVQRADNSYLTRLLDSLYQSQYRVFKMESDTLNLRMGELREMERVHGVWLRTKYGRLESAATEQTTASWDEYTHISFGYDQNFSVLGGVNFLGLALSTTAFRNHGIADNEDFSGESYYASSRTYGISVYDTYFFDSGVYIDSLLKYYLTDNNFSIRSEVLNGNYPKFLTHALMVELEVGKKFRLPIKTPNFARSFYYLKPEFVFNTGFVSGTKQTLKDWSNQPIKATLDFNAPINTRLGLSFGRQFDSNHVKGDVYLGTSFEYDFNTGGDLRLEDFLDKMTLSHKGSFTWRINAGTNVILNQYWRLYFDIDTAFFGLINSVFTLNGGVRINFGQLHPKLPYIPPNMEAPQDFTSYPKYRRTIPEVQNYDTQGILDNYSGARKRQKFPPKINVKNKAYDDGDAKGQKVQPNVTPAKVNSAPPTFIDDPTSITLPSTNYKRDNSLAPTTSPKERSMQGIYDKLQKGYR